MAWENLLDTEKKILLSAYAAKLINLNGNGSITKPQLEEVYSRIENHKIEEIRQKIKNNEDECRNLIYGKIQ